MKQVIYDISEFTDSREVMEANRLRYAIIFMYMIITVLMAFLIWAYFAEIDVTIKVNGVVRPTNEVNRIMNECSGKVEHTSIKNGEKVDKFQELYQIDHSQLDLQKSSLEEKIKKAENDLDNFNKLKESINDKKNYFDENNKDDSFFYNKYLQYENSYNDELTKKNVLKNQVQDIEEHLENFKLLQKSIDDDQNYFSKDNSFYNQFEDYKLNEKQYNDKINEAERNYNIQKQLGESDAIPENDVIKSKNDLENAKDELKKYQSQYTLNIQQGVDQYEEKLSETQTTLTGADTVTLNEISQIDSNIKEGEENLDTLKDSLETINLNIEKCSVKSPVSGIINTSNEIKEGDILQSGAEVATIVPDNNLDYKVQLYVLNNDIANIKNGQKIKCHFSALPYQEYGYLEGEITNISVDSTPDTKTGTSFYLVEASIENKPLYSYKKEKNEIKIGMNCDANIVTERKKVIYYLFEKLNLDS